MDSFTHRADWFESHDGGVRGVDHYLILLMLEDGLNGWGGVNSHDLPDTREVGYRCILGLVYSQLDPDIAVQ